MPRDIVHWCCPLIFDLHEGSALELRWWSWSTNDPVHPELDFAF